MEHARESARIRLHVIATARLHFDAKRPLQKSAFPGPVVDGGTPTFADYLEEAARVMIGPRWSWRVQRYSLGADLVLELASKGESDG